MCKVKVKYRGHLANLTRVSEESYESNSIKGILKLILEHHGREAEKIARSMLIAVNGESIHLLKQFKTSLKDGDVIDFFPLCAGG